MVTDIFPALALGLGKGDNTIMNNPPRDPKKLIVSNRDWYEILLYAAVISLAVVSAIYYHIYFYSADEIILNNLAFITLAFAQLFHVFNMSSKNAKLIINDITKNKFVWIALVLCISFLAIVFAVPTFRMVLKLAVLPLEVWIISIVSGLLPLVIIQSYKLLVRKVN
jgi:Ca2+-transporting ATPase